MVRLETRVTKSAATEPLTPEIVIDAATKLIELEGPDALTMRRLSDELGTAVTAIYWHVGNRDALLDAVVDHSLADMGTFDWRGSTAKERIDRLARDLRSYLLEHRNLTALVHQRGKIQLMFHPVQAALAHELSQVGLHGSRAALVLESLQMHVIASVTLQRAAERGPTQESTYAEIWGDHPDDPQLVSTLADQPDYDAVFGYGLAALLATLPDG